MNKELEGFFEEYNGLSEEEVLNLREKYGANVLKSKKKLPFIFRLLAVFKEPMFLLLIITASVYFIIGEYADGCLMLVFVVVISMISFFQENKTEKALEELSKLSAVNVKVIRNKMIKTVTSEELVVGDLVILEEGDSVPADGTLLYAEGLGINEAMLTGESAVVYKNILEDVKNHFKLNMVYSGTSVVGGVGLFKVSNVGIMTEIGKIGSELEEIKKGKSPLTKQVNKLVYVCTIISVLVCVFTMIINFINFEDLSLKERIIESILAGITIAMATIPEEIPVILTVFLALGASGLAKEKTLVKNLNATETLGAINVLCTDKTGTLTQNKMDVAFVYENNKSFGESAVRASLKVSIDPMEKAIKKYFSNVKIKSWEVLREYPFSNVSKMMGILWSDGVLCIKGAYESVLALCKMNDELYENVVEDITHYMNEGYRVLAVARARDIKDDIEKLSDASYDFEGFIVLEDPPRKNVYKSVKACNNAGIRVIMITGDNGSTALGIANKIGLINNGHVITGEELEKMSDGELFLSVQETNIFARVYPNHKMRIVEALQKNNNVVAMTGDGVNDASALKKADVGIAMGLRGTNVSKEAADIIILDDNFNTIVKGVFDARGIYKNIKKAISYIFVIHIPIALLSLFVPLFNLPLLLKPIHILLLELLIDPTSSIIFQRIKNSKDIMYEKPRKKDENIIHRKTVIRSVSQGLLIFLITFLNYYFLIHLNIITNKAITITYSTLVLSIILVSFQLRTLDSTFKTLTKALKDKSVLVVNLFIIAGLILLVYLPYFNSVANTMPLNILEWGYVVCMAIICVVPFDLFKKKIK